MASAPHVQFGRDVALPPGAVPFGLVFSATAINGNQLAGSATDSVGINVAKPMAAYAITGHSSQAKGFAAQIYVTRNGQQRQLGAVSFNSANLVGTAQRPAMLEAPEILNPGDQVTVELSNLSANAADVQLVLWAGMTEAE